MRRDLRYALSKTGNRRRSCRSEPGSELAGNREGLRRPEEYTIFLGRGVRVLAGTETEWLGGIIDGVEAGTLWLRGEKGGAGSRFPDIRKARLDHSVEVEEAKNDV